MLRKIEDRNIILLGVGFLFVYTAYQTTAAVSEVVLDSYNAKNEASISGYIGMALNYAGTTLMALFVPGFLLFISAKSSVILGSVLSVLMAASYIYPTPISIYLFSFISGVGGAFIWVGQGAIVISNSDDKTIDRNTSVFWLLYQLSQFGGTLYVFFAWQGKQTVDSHERIVLFILLCCIGACGVLTLCFIKTIQGQDESEINTGSLSTREKLAYLWRGVKESFQFWYSYHFGMLFLITAYIGFELAFFQTIYPTAVANTKQLGTDSDRLTGLIVVFIGIGEVSGSFSTGIASKSKMIRRGPIAAFGLIIEVFAFAMILLNIPSDAVKHPVSTIAFIEPIVELLYLAAFLIGFGDALLNAQLMNFIKATTENEREAAAAFMLFNFAESGVATLVFFIGDKINLHVQLLVLMILLLVCLSAFLKLDLDVRSGHYNHKKIL